MVLAVKSLPPARYPTGVKLMRIWRRRMRERLLSVLLTIQIFILFVMPAVRAAGLPLPRVAVYLTLLIFVTLAIFLSRSRVAIVMMIISVALTVAGVIWRNEHADLLPDALSSVGQVLTQVSLLWAVSTAVFGAGRTTHHRILGAVVMYLSIGTIFTSIYLFMAQIIPNAFNHLPSTSVEVREALTYYSFSTLTTSSFGDIVPIHPVARSLANVEAVCGQLFPATLLARIVGLHGLSRDDESKKIIPVSSRDT